MQRLYSWQIARSGAAMTITHSCGKLSGFVGVEYDPRVHKIIATHKDGRAFELGGVLGVLGKDGELTAPK